MNASPLVGVLALQGGFAAHARIVEQLGGRATEVRTAAELEPLDALILPGGESTTMSLAIERDGLAEPLTQRVSGGLPTLATCAGLIILDRDHLGVLDLSVRRNAFGRQSRSFEADLELDGITGGPVHAVFIRAPWVTEHGPAVEVLAEVDGHPVAVRQNGVTAVSFHPELSGETRLHAALIAAARSA